MFDKVVAPDQTQEHLFNELSDIANCVIDG